MGIGVGYPSTKRFVEAVKREILTALQKNNLAELHIALAEASSRVDKMSWGLKDPDKAAFYQGLADGLGEQADICEDYLAGGDTTIEDEDMKDFLLNDVEWEYS